jgi:hypothetical protein
MCDRVVAMEDIYDEAAEGFEVGSSTHRRIQALIRDAWGLEIAISGLGAFVEGRPQPPYGARQTLGSFNTMLEAQNFEAHRTIRSSQGRPVHRAPPQSFRY